MPWNEESVIRPTRAPSDESPVKRRESLEKLEFYELSQKVFDPSIPNQDILDAGQSAFKQGKIQFWQLKNMFFTMPDRANLVFIRLKHDTPAVREYFFQELRTKIGSSCSYWGDTAEGANQDFNSLVQDIGKLTDANQLPDESKTSLQDRAINELVRVILRDDAAARHVKTVAHVFFDFPDISSHSKPISGSFDAQYTEKLEQEIERLIDPNKDEQTSFMP